MDNIYNVAVLGSTGYVGMELVKLLTNHKNVNINFLGTENNEGKYLKNIDNTKEYKNLPILKDNNSFDPSMSDYVFIALPHSISNIHVKKLFNKIKIIDLSADFRLDDYEVYKENYGSSHSCKDLLKFFTYGLAEINRNLIKNSSNIAVPGCYPTSILLPLIPLLQNQFIETENIIIDSKSGYSGAGKNFNVSKIKSKNDFNFYNYNTNEHRHISEISQELQKHNTSKDIKFSFNPHILPNFRGMISTIYCDLKNNVTKKNIIDVFKNFDKFNPFIKCIDDSTNLDFYSIQNTNFCKIKLLNHYSQGKIIISSGIDNLIKGAAGQAVQCFNIMEKMEETESLI